MEIEGVEGSNGLGDTAGFFFFKSRFIVWCRAMPYVRQYLWYITSCFYLVCVFYNIRGGENAIELCLLSCAILWEQLAECKCSYRLSGIEGSVRHYKEVWYWSWRRPLEKINGKRIKDEIRKMREGEREKEIEE